MVAYRLALGLYGLASLPYSTAASASADARSSSYCSVIKNGNSAPGCKAPPSDFLAGSGGSTGPKADASVLDNAFKALAELQNDYYDASELTWPTSIDWTGAVIQTIVSSTMSALTKSFNATVGDNVAGWKEKENLLSFLHEQVVAYYFGQQAERIKGEAYDDVLWVVLGWIEALNFRRLHEDLHYAKAGFVDKPIPEQLPQALQQTPWHGQFWRGRFGERADDFWAFSTQGWDDVQCHGGMTWNPRLETYKNAITNELYIAGSIAMYQYWPGSYDGKGQQDPRQLNAAIEGYKWITNVNMTNAQGLFVDGFHINHAIPGNVECDQRDEMVYTYNQGVILTGNRGLFEVTGAPSYLDDGHRYIRSVINATGWDLRTNQPKDHITPGQLPPWRGLGRGGILEDQCDSSATCSQDSQTFKGIYFHHLAAFCSPLTLTHPNNARMVVDDEAFQKVQDAHSKTCGAYLDWVKYNVDAALKTRDSKGHFGMWWGASLFGDVSKPRSDDGINHFAANVTDYRNEGTPQDNVWGFAKFVPGGGNATAMAQNRRPSGGDPNDRGRGRTVETQAGGLALLKAYWEISQTS